MIRMYKTLKWILVLCAALLSASLMLLWYLATSETGLQWVGEISRTTIPGKLTWKSLKGNILDGPQIEGFQYNNNHVDVRISTFSVNWNLLVILTGEIHIEKLRVNDIAVNMLSESSDTQTSDTNYNDYLDLSFMPSLPFTLKVSDAQAQRLSILNLSEEIFSAEAMTLGAIWAGKQFNIQHAVISSEHYAINASGKLGLESGAESDLDIQWEINAAEYPPLAGHTRLVGNLEQLNIEHSQTQPGTASLNGILSNLLDTPQLALNIKWDNFVLQTLDPSYPTQYLGGNIDVKADRSKFNLHGEISTDFIELPEKRVKITSHGNYTTDEIQIDSLNLNVPGIATQIDDQGNWLFESNQFKLALNWKSLQWPMVNSAEIESSIGSAQIEGQLDSYSLDAEAEVSGKTLPQASAKLFGNGSLESLLVENLHIETLEGHIEGQGTVTWIPQVSWQAELSGNDINPQRMVADLPGLLNARLTSSGSIVDSRVQISAQLLQLDGQLRGSPISGKGGIVFIDDELQIPELQLESGTAQLNVSGIMSNSWDMQWSLKAADIASIASNIKGNINATGTLSGDKESPLLAGQLSGNTIALNNIKINKLDLNWQTTLDKELAFQATLKSQSISVNEIQLEQVNVNSSGNAKSHKLTLDGQGKDIAININLDGGLYDNTWRGQLLKADWTGPRVGSWQLKESVKLRLGEKDIEVSPSCWHSQDAHLCFELVGNNKHGWDSKLSVKKLPLSMVHFMLPPYIDIEGLVEASMESKISPAGQLKGTANIELAPGHYFVGVSENRIRYPYQGGKLQAVMNNEGLKGDGQILLHHDNGITVNLDLPHFKFSKAIQEQPFNLQVKGKLNDFSFIEATSLNAIQVKGELQTDLGLSGTIGAPKFKGHSRWQQGSVNLPDNGVLLEQIDMHLDGSQRDKLVLTGSARSNQGVINLQGNMNLKTLKNWHASLSIKGENFEIIDTPESHIFISPDLTVDLAKHKVDIKGKLTIPEARIKPSKLDTAVSSSKDVVILDPSKEKTQTAVWAISSEMRLLLGDKVWFDGFGLKAWLKGDLQLSDKPGQTATGRGELGINEGTFRAFGRPLKIDRGRLVFRGGPIDNPGLDVAASRSIDKEGVHVSVSIGGTLVEPTFKTSSEPPMAQTDVLSYLLYGKKSDENTSISSDILVQAAASAGIGSTGLTDSVGDKLKLTEFSISGSSKEDMAMTLGSYLSPSLFIGYTFGLYEADSQFQLNYRLSKRWNLEMETSTEATGGDIFYSFER